MPSPPAGLNPLSLLGEWHIVATTLPFWRGKRRPAVRYTEVGGVWRDELFFESRDPFGRWGARRLGGVDTPDPTAPGRFTWRGEGVLGILSSTWCFVAVDPAGTWSATWFSRASFGLTPEGMDVYAREPAFSEERIAEITATLALRPELSHLAGWFRPDR